MFNIQGFYKIKPIVNCSLHKEKVKTYLLSQSVKGTVILSPEGINGTIAGRRSKVNSCIRFIKDRFSIATFDSNNSSTCSNRIKIKCESKKEKLLCRPKSMEQINQQEKCYIDRCKKTF